MDKTEKLKHIILSKYNSIREFAKIAEIPSTTLTSALDKGIGGMAIDRVIKICEVLNIDVKTFEPINTSPQKINLSSEETKLLDNFNKLNDLGKKKVIDYTADLSDNIKYTKNDNVTELITATKEEPKLQDMFTTIAAHDDDLTEDEKAEMDRRILEALKKREK